MYVVKGPLLWTWMMAAWTRVLVVEGCEVMESNRAPWIFIELSRPQPLLPGKSDISLRWTHLLPGLQITFYSLPSPPRHLLWAPSQHFRLVFSKSLHLTGKENSKNADLIRSYSSLKSLRAFPWLLGKSLQIKSSQNKISITFWSISSFPMSHLQSFPMLYLSMHSRHINFLWFLPTSGPLHIMVLLSRRLSHTLLIFHILQVSAHVSFSGQPLLNLRWGQRSLSRCA